MPTPDDDWRTWLPAILPTSRDGAFAPVLATGKNLEPALHGFPVRTPAVLVGASSWSLRQLQRGWALNRGARATFQVPYATRTEIEGRW